MSALGDVGHRGAGDPRRPLRWLLMASHVPSGGSLGGIVRYTVELARALSRRDDVELVLSATRSSAEWLRPLVARGQDLRVLPPVPEAALPLVERHALGRSLGRGVDVVQGAKHLLPRGVRALTALTVHDMILLDRPGDFPAPKRLLLAGPYLASLRQADVPLCVSAATRERLRAHLPGVAERAALTPLASSPSLLAATPTPVAALAGRRFALVVGDPTPRKNVPVVLEAWARLAARAPDAVLALVGPPSWGESRYGDRLEELERAGRLVRLERVPDDVLAWCYRHAAAVLCPSLVEGFGLPVVEGLDLGAPVLVSADPAQVEAAAGRARAVLPVDSPGAWADAVAPLLAGTGRPGAWTPAPAPRTWDDVAADSVAAVRARLAAPAPR